MSVRALLKVLGAFVAIVVVVCFVVHRAVALSPRQGPIVATVWRGGDVVERAVLTRDDERPEAIARALAVPGSTLVLETIVADAPLTMAPELLRAISLVPGVDGVEATLGDAKVYVTPDDLLRKQAYDHGVTLDALQLTFGVDLDAVDRLLADRFHADIEDILARARFRRIRVVRRVVGEEIPTPVLDVDTARAAVLGGARYLARGMTDDGRFRFYVDAINDEVLPGYDWPRHGGATWFLVQAAAATHDPDLALAARRSAAQLRDHLLACGDARCIGASEVVDLGSSALALLAFTDLVRTHLDDGYLKEVVDLARFLEHQQRDDGEFMHQYDRAKNKPIDVQWEYFSGEASFALARAYRVTHDDAELSAARRGLAHIVGPAWRFFGNRYWFGEEHWTCQAAMELWDTAPDRAALDFCMRWSEWNRALLLHGSDAQFDVDGALGFGPLFTPRLTPVAGRAEAWMATLVTAERAGLPRAQIDPVEEQVRRALGLLLRHQLRPGPAHIFKNPNAVYGALTTSTTEFQIRVDYVQHACCAILRWLEREQSRNAQ